jgi:hypothetical protein
MPNGRTQAAQSAGAGLGKGLELDRSEDVRRLDEVDALDPVCDLRKRVERLISEWQWHNQRLVSWPSELSSQRWGHGNTYAQDVGHQRPPARAEFEQADLGRRAVGLPACDEPDGHQLPNKEGSRGESTVRRDVKTALFPRGALVPSSKARVDVGVSCREPEELQRESARLTSPNVCEISGEVMKSPSLPKTSAPRAV